MTSRRGWLALVAGGLSALAGCGFISESEPGTDAPRGGSPTTHASRTDDGEGDGIDGSPTEERTSTDEPILPESSFETVVDMVDDVGADPTGETPVDDEFDAALSEDTLVVFPDGRYALERRHGVDGFDRVGVVGRGDAVLVPPRGWNDKLLDVQAVGEFFLRGFDVDVTRENTTAGLTVACRDRFRVEDVEFVGRGTHTDADVIHALNARLLEPDGVGVVRNVVAKRGSAVDRYKNGNGRAGIYVGPSNRGTITIEDCRLEEFGNNGVYASRTPGDVRVVGGVFRNNNVCGVRLGGRGSSVEDALVEVDVSKYAGPPFDRGDAKLRGVVVEQKTEQGEILKPAGMVMRRCTVRAVDNPTNGPPVVVWSNGKTLSIEDCQITVENDTPAVLRDGIQRQGTNPAWRGRRWIRFSNTKITGAEASDTPAVRLLDAPGSTFRNCQISRTDRGCTGVELARSGGVEIHGGSIRTHGVPVLIEVGEDEAEDGECLISFAEEPTVEMLGGDDSGSVLTTTACGSSDDPVVGAVDGAGEGTASESSGGDGTPAACCITWDDLVETATADVPAVGITGVDDRSVTVRRLGI